MPINMVWRWEVRGPRGLMEVLVAVRMLLDTWSLAPLDCAHYGVVVVVVWPGLSCHHLTGPHAPTVPPLTFQTQLMLSGGPVRTWARSLSVITMQ